MTATGAADDAVAEVAALSIQLEEAEWQREQQRLLRQQFESYEKSMDFEEADAWDMRGDLMASRKARRTHQLEHQDPGEVFLVGHGDLSERLFFNLLSSKDIRVLYDFRPEAERSPLPQFALRN